MSIERDGFTSIISQSLRLTLAGWLALLACAAGIIPESHAQDTAAQVEDSAPPPMKYVPEAARAQLSTARDLKARTRLTLELAEKLLVRAAEHTDAERFAEAAGDLAVYQALIEDGIEFLQKSGRPAGKLRDIFKRIEMTLRSHLPRIETVRRATPSRHAVYVKATLDYVRNARAEALNAFYDDTVLPDASGKNEEASGDAQRAKGAIPVVPEKEKKP